MCVNRHADLTFWFPLGNRVNRDVLDTTVNFSAHAKFVTKWLDKIEAEEGKSTADESAVPAPAGAEGAEPVSPTGEGEGEQQQA